MHRTAIAIKKKILPEVHNFTALVYISKVAWLKDIIYLDGKKGDTQHILQNLGSFGNFTELFFSKLKHGTRLKKIVF